MNSKQYSYAEIAALDAVRARFAAGDAVAIMTPALDRMIWANGAGATLFGYSSVDAIVGAEPQVGLAAKRQIMATSGYPRIGTDRAITVRLASGLMSRAIAFKASEIALPGGAEGILLASATPSSGARGSAETASRAIAGLDGAGAQAAILDASGNIVAASNDFAALGLDRTALAGLARGERLLKEVLPGAAGRLATGVARVADEPAQYLVLVSEQAVADEAHVEVAPEQAPQEEVPQPELDAVEAPDVQETPAVESAQHADRDQQADNDLQVEERPAFAGAEAAEIVHDATSEPQADDVQPMAAHDTDSVSARVELNDQVDSTLTGNSEPADEPPTFDGEQAGAVDLQMAPAGSATSEQPDVEHRAEAGPVDATAQAEPDPIAELDRAVDTERPGDRHAADETAIAADVGATTATASTDEKRLEPVDAVEQIDAVATEASLEAAEQDGGILEAVEAAIDAPSDVASDAAHSTPEPALVADASTQPAADTRRVDEAVAATMAKIASTVNEGLAAKDAAAEPTSEARQAESGAVGEGSHSAEEAPIDVDRSAAPVRFVWKTDAEGRLSEIAREFVAVVGPSTTRLVGMTFREAAQRLGIDRGGEIAGLLERRDTWSGRSVLWPVEGTDLRVPVDLAALPTYDRDRNFAGFRGFGVARAADAIVDPDAEGPSPTLFDDYGVDQLATGQDGDHPARPQGADPFRGEVPILTIVPKQDRRASDKIIRLAEHRGPAGERVLSPGEQSAFREIGNRLKKDNGAAGAETADTRRADNDQPAPQALVDSTLVEPGSEVEPPVASETELVAPSAAFEGVLPLDIEVQEEPAERDAPEAARVVEIEHDAELDAFAEAAAAQDHRDHATAADIEIEPAAEAFEESEATATTASDDGTAAEVDVAATVGATEPLEASPSAGKAAAAAAQHADYMPSAFALGADKREPAPVDTSILEQLPVPVLIHAGDLLHYANREFLELTGYDSVDNLAEAGGLGVLFGEPYPAEEGAEENGRKLRLRTSEGLEYPVEAFLQSVPWGAGKALLLSLRRSWRQPVSYPVAQPAAPPVDPDLEARIEEMRAIVDTATDGVVLITADGLIRSISRPAEALFGFDSDQVAGKPFTSLFAIESQRAARDYLNGLTDHGVASVLNDGREVIGRESQGRFIPLFMTIGKLPDDSGYCAVVRDITQWKRAEEELTQARAQAERASSQKTDFLARVSHEIRTPLNAIIGFSELMLDEKFGPIHNDRYKDYLRDINRSGNHVLDLVNDLLDISKIEAGQQEMSYEAVSLNDTLTETVAMMQPQANRERVIIRSSFASRLPEVVADLRSVRQIALNLLSNAIRYTPAGGQVIVSTAYESSGDVVMRVRDTGIGMSQPEIEQALKPFKQINALKRTRGDGTGLGLPLTKAMVEANRARFIINSTPGEGTLVEITFPSTRVLAD